MPAQLIPPAAGAAARPRLTMAHLRGLALRGLARMYLPGSRRFAFRMAQRGTRLELEGRSFRYTAIALIGLVDEEPAATAQILAGASLKDVGDSLVEELPAIENLGDAALALWATSLLDHPRRLEAHAHLARLLAAEPEPYTVEAAWALAALCHDWTRGNGPLRTQATELLLAAWHDAAALFGHRVGGERGVRGHVACFADQVYPIHALASAYAITGHAPTLQVAERCALRICELLGPAGQWWWHYDVRTGAVVERYPVYAVHQDAMAPMALHALREAGGPDLSAALARGLDWLHSAPELHGGSLVDEAADLIWRKVARREPVKLARRVEALASRVRPGWRIPLDRMLPPGAIDREDRPYHLGWLLHAWPSHRAEQWDMEFSQ